MVVVVAAAAAAAAVVRVAVAVAVVAAVARRLGQNYDRGHGMASWVVVPETWVVLPSCSSQ